MADIESVWGEEEKAKFNRTLMNPKRLTDIEPCADARTRIIKLTAEVQRLNSLLTEAGISTEK